MTVSNENLASGNQESDIGFEERRLAATVAEAAEKLPEDLLKAAINTGLNKGGSHLFVDDQPVSSVLDEHGNPKRGPRGFTREDIIFARTALRYAPKRVIKKTQPKTDESITDLQDSEPSSD